jgi:putative ABC transport system ATP-binding protein
MDFLPRAGRCALIAANGETGCPVIDLRGVSKIFRAETIETYALRDLELQIQAGEFVAVTGHSGSGKTTLLNIAGLLDEFDSGEYRLDGERVSALSDNARSRLRNRKIGFVFQSFHLIQNLTVLENVEAPLEYRRLPASERRRRAYHCLEQVGLTHRVHHLPAQLSGGQQQRTAIARAIATEPRLILADEPTGNLDSTMSEQIMSLLRSLNAHGTTILMVTHNDELARCAHRRIELIDGQVAAQATRH